MARWTVLLTEKAEIQLKAHFEQKLISVYDIKVLKQWILEVETEGLPWAQQSRTWRDHAFEGPWQGYRAISFSFSGRLIYKVEEAQVVARVVRVTPNHSYTRD